MEESPSTATSPVDDTPESKIQANTPSVPKPLSSPKSKHKNKPSPSKTSRSIRANFDTETITLYQAYNASIADAAVSTQNLAASPLYSRTRTTWLKPSWAWMLYRSGYSYKDVNQARILALKIRHAHFAELLSYARIAGEKSLEDPEGLGRAVVVQWDPERSVRIGKIDDGQTRSIQIGVRKELNEKLVGEWIVGIEDVTEKARELKRLFDEEEVEGRKKRGRRVEVDELVGRGLVPVERTYDFMLPRGVREKLLMDEVVDEEDLDVLG